MSQVDTPSERRRKARFLAIPEIARAYENDPRTRLAASMMGANNGGAVAEGKYGMADGIARAIQGIAGAYMQKQGYEKAMGDQDTLMTDRTKMAQDGLSGMAASTASALGAPPPAQAVPQTQAPPMGPTMGQPPAPLVPGAPASPMNPMLQMAGGQEDGMRPFHLTSSTGAGSSFGHFNKPRVLNPGQSSRAPVDQYHSYKSTAYDELEAKYEQQYGLPSGILSRIRTRGERSNANQVSPVGARTVYQFMPSTRALFKKKYGVDAYAGPDQAAQAAALHLKESLDRNNGDANLAIREYHGGPDRSRWGKENRKYIGRAGYGQGEDATARTPDDGTQPLSPIDIPDIPPELERPNRPEAVAATQSDKLRAAYQMMIGGNAYDSTRAMDMYGEGLTEQSRFKENASEREQALRNTEYGSDLGAYQNDRADRRTDALGRRRDAEGRVFQRAERLGGQSYGTSERVSGQNFTADQAEIERAARAAEARIEHEERRATELKILNREIEGRTELEREKGKVRRQSYFQTPGGSKEIKAAGELTRKNTETLATLDALEGLLDEGAKTGGFVRGNAPWVTRWSDSKQQAFEALADQLALANVGEMKGALSNADREFVQRMGPNVSKNVKTNKWLIKRAKNILERQLDFQDAMIASKADGRPDVFLREWREFLKDVPQAGTKTFSEWRSSIPRYGY